MSNVAGVVEVIKSQASGRATSAKIGGEWYSNGFVTEGNLPYKIGQRIEFQFTEKNGFKNVDLKSVKVQEERAAGAAQAAAPQAKVDYAARDARKEALDAQRQRSIQLQASRNSAIHVAEIAMQHGLLNVGAKKGEALDHLLNFIDDLAARYSAQTSEAANGGAQDPQAEKSFE